jgi:hypothetical protein
MFFQETEINEVIKCSICKETFTDPRLLPCGQTTCSSCVMPMMTSNEDKQWLAQCPFCSKRHVVPENESSFPPNTVVARLIEKKPRPVIRSRDEEMLRQRLTEIDRLIHRFEQGPALRLSNIADYCQSLRNQVDLRTEELKHELDLASQSLRERIDSFEAECVNHHHDQIKNEDVKNRFDEFVKEARSVYSSKMEYLSRMIIDERGLCEANKQSLFCLNKLNLEHDRLLSASTSKEESLLFESSKKKLESESIGVLRLAKRVPVIAQFPRASNKNRTFDLI